ncbi:MAG: MmgE/PrpD family protein, partial [Hyphomicrobiales bacterium]
MRGTEVSQTHITRLATFATTTSAGDLPQEIAEETKRIILDSVGCALAATETDAGRIGIDYGRVLG